MAEEDLFVDEISGVHGLGELGEQDALKSLIKVLLKKHGEVLAHVLHFESVFH